MSKKQLSSVLLTVTSATFLIKLLKQLLPSLFKYFRVNSYWAPKWIIQ